MNHIDVDGLRIAYERAGQGPPLVLLHGLLGDSRAWRRQVESLADAFTVVAWDAPGCGRSADPPPSFRMPEYADILAGFVGALRLDRPHVLGLSFGAVLALELYRQRQVSPRTLVLASGYAGWAGSLPPEVVQERLATCLAEAEQSPDQFIPGWIPGLLTDAASVEVVEEVTTMMSAFHPAGYRAMSHALAEADLRDVLAQINVPTLLLYGDLDSRSPLSVAVDLHARIVGSTLVVVPGVGHLSNVEAPDPFNREIRGFLIHRGS